jgi:sensor c-di-GMP phosphodiesterase-like protein
MKTVAEGVETYEQLELLRALGCDAVQGFLLSRPTSAPDLAQWLTGGTFTKLKKLVTGSAEGLAHGTQRTPKARH